LLDTAPTGLKTLFNFAYLFVPSMSTSAKAKAIIPKVTKALAWKYCTDNNNGTTVTYTLCKPKDVRVKVFEITNPKYYNLRYPKSHLRIQENCTIILQAIGGSTKGLKFISLCTVIFDPPAAIQGLKRSGYGQVKWLTALEYRHLRASGNPEKSQD